MQLTSIKTSLWIYVRMVYNTHDFFFFCILRSVEFYLSLLDHPHALQCLKWLGVLVLFVIGISSSILQYLIKGY